MWRAVSLFFYFVSFVSEATLAQSASLEEAQGLKLQLLAKLRTDVLK
jgi:hypothetical protein